MKWTAETRKIEDLHENPKNPRYLTKEQAEHLQQSIHKFGLCEPIVINTDGQIIGGHQRIKTLKRMGETEVDVYLPDRLLDQKEAEELTVRLNKNIGSWDFDILANSWDMQDLLAWGFTAEELLQDDEEKDDPTKFSLVIQLDNADHLKQVQSQLSDKFPDLKVKAKVS